MRRFALVLSTVMAAFAGLPFVFATPFDAKNVAADPAFVIHFDCDAIRTSAVGKSILSQPDVQEKLTAAGALFDVDFLTQLHGITVYATAAHANDRVMLVYADFDPDRLLAKAQTLSDFRGVTNGARVIYNWQDDRRTRRVSGVPRVYGAISGHLIVLGQSEARLADALDVMEGKARGFDGGKELPPADRGEVLLLEAALLKVDRQNAQGPAALFAMSKSVRLKVSEAGRNTTAALRFETADDDTATQVNGIAQGLLGMLKMTSEDTNALKFANSIAISKDSLVVGLKLSLPSSEMIEMMKAGQEKGEQRRSNRRARDRDTQPNNK